MKQYPTVLSIAGSDCSGGAGIQADIKTITLHSCYAASVITTLTAQNTQGVNAISPVTPSFVRAQLEAVFSDINIGVVKIGMLDCVESIEHVADMLRIYKPLYIIIDPVMTAKCGTILVKQESVERIKQQLLPLASLITPNIPEAELLSQQVIQTKADMQICAKQLSEQYHINVLVKGGHLESKDAIDVLYSYDDAAQLSFIEKRIRTSSTHGTGCSLSSAIAANLAKGFELSNAIQQAKTYVVQAIRAASHYRLGQGYDPIHHNYFL